MAQIPITPPLMLASVTARIVRSSSSARPVNEEMSLGNVRCRPEPDSCGCETGASAPAATPDWAPRAVARNSARAGPVRLSAVASSLAVGPRGVRLISRSRSLIVRGLKAADSASCSCVSPAPVLSRRNSVAKLGAELSISNDAAPHVPPSSHGLNKSYGTLPANVYRPRRRRNQIARATMMGWPQSPEMVTNWRVS